MRSLLSLAFLLGACGGAGSFDTAYRDEGDCAPPPGAVALMVSAQEVGQALGASCLRSGSEPFLVARSQAELEGLFCPHERPLPADFSATQLLIVPGYGAGEGTEVRFLAEGGDRFSLGRYHRPRGTPPDDVVLRMPRSDKPIVTLECRQVCLRGCDRAIP